MKSVDLDVSQNFSGDTQEAVVDSFKQAMDSLAKAAEKLNAEVLWGTLEISTEVEIVDNSSISEFELERYRTITIHAIGATGGTS